MTGAGSSQVAVVQETAFDSLPGTPSYFLPGRNLTVDELNLQRQLERMRVPSEIESVESVAGPIDGAINVSYAMSDDTHSQVRNLVFNDGGGGFSTGHATTSSWYIGAEYLDTVSTTATAERHLRAAIPLEYSIQYQRGTNTVQESLSMGYANEDLNTTLTPGSVTGPTDGSDVPFHGVTLTIDGATVDRLQSCTMSYSNLYRYHTDADPNPVDAVLANPTGTLEVEAILNTTDYTNLAYGSTSATTIQDSMVSVSGSLAFDVGGSTVATYSLSKLKVDQEQWNSVVDAENDTAESLTFNIDGQVSVS